MPAPDGGSGGSTPDPMAMLKSGSYLRLLVLAAIIGVPVSAAAYGFEKRSLYSRISRCRVASGSSLVRISSRWMMLTAPSEPITAASPVGQM